MKKMILSVAMATVVASSVFSQNTSSILKEFEQALDGVEKEYWTSMCSKDDKTAFVKQLGNLSMLAKRVDSELNPKISFGNAVNVLKKIYQAGPYGEIEVKENTLLVETEGDDYSYKFHRKNSQGSKERKKIIEEHGKAQLAATRMANGHKILLTSEKSCEKGSYPAWVNTATEKNVEAFSKMKVKKLGIKVEDYFTSIRDMRLAIVEMEKPDSSQKQ